MAEVKKKLVLNSSSIHTVSLILYIQGLEVDSILYMR